MVASLCGFRETPSPTALSFERKQSRPPPLRSLLGQPAKGAQPDPQGLGVML